jgi:hypothetical protein
MKKAPQTFTSKGPNLAELNKELSKIKSSMKEITQCRYRNGGKEVHKSIENYQQQYQKGKDVV